MSWIVGNGEQTLWRIWEGGSPSWTRFKDEATRFARRVDAEAVHAEDEEAWTVIELEELLTSKTAVAPVASVPTDAQIKDATTEYLSHRGERPYRVLRGGQEL